MDKIRCISSTTYEERYPVVKVWLKMHDIQYEERAHSVGGSHFWTTIHYELTKEQLMELLSYLREAEVLNDINDITI